MNNQKLFTVTAQTTTLAEDTIVATLRCDTFIELDPAAVAEMLRQYADDLEMQGFEVV